MQPVDLIPSSKEHPFVAVLLEVAKAAPLPWHYRKGLARTSENQWRVEQITQILEVLHQRGLVDRRELSPEDGPGVVLTDAGRKVAMSPDERRKLAELADRHFEELTETGKLVQESIRPNLTPWLARSLALAIIVHFCWGLSLAHNRGLFQVYLTGFPGQATAERYLKLIHDMGGLRASDLLEGMWWRILTNSLLSMGGLQLLIGVWMTWGLAANAERYFGRWRTLVILLLSEWGCACVALAMDPTPRGSDLLPPVQGTTGAFAGFISAIGVWTLLVSHHLPAEMASALRTQLVINIIIMGVISFMPGASPWGYAGGAAGGGLAAFALHFGRFGPIHVRPLAHMSLIGLAWLGFWFLQSRRETSPEWLALEAPHYKSHVSIPAEKADKVAHKAYKPISDLFKNYRPDRYPPDKVEESIKAIQKPLEDLVGLRDTLRVRSLYQSRLVRDAYKSLEAYLARKIEFYRESIRALELGVKWTKEDEAGHQAILKKLNEEFKNWVDAEKEFDESKPKKRARE